MPDPAAIPDAPRAALLGDDPLAVALALAALGVPVFPAHGVDVAGRCTCGGGCGRSAGKHPRTPRGLRDAALAPEQIRAWWRRWPEANPAAVTGAAAGVWVLDADEGSGGLDALEALEFERGEISATWAVETGGGGLHLWFAHPGLPVPSSAGKLGPGIDVRGEGGYVICPPARHRSGARYAWAAGWRPDAVPLAPAPPWLRDLACAPAGRALTHHRPPPKDVGVMSSHSDAAEPIPEGRRNATLTSMGGAMRRRGFGEAAILAALLAENAARCAPPLPASEVERVACSVARYAPEPAPGQRGGGFVEFGGGRGVRE